MTSKLKLLWWVISLTASVGIAFVLFVIGLACGLLFIVAVYMGFYHICAVLACLSVLMAWTSVLTMSGVQPVFDELWEKWELDYA